MRELLQRYWRWLKREPGQDGNTWMIIASGIVLLFYGFLGYGGGGPWLLALIGGGERSCSAWLSTCPPDGTTPSSLYV